MVFLGLSKLGEKKQVRIPNKAIDKLEIKTDDDLIFLEKGGEVIIKKVQGEEVADLVMK